MQVNHVSCSNYFGLNRTFKGNIPLVDNGASKVVNQAADKVMIAYENSILTRPLHEINKRLLPYVPEANFANKSAKDAAHIILFRKGKPEELAEVIQQEGNKYVTRQRVDEAGKPYSLLREAFSYNKNLYSIKYLVDEFGEEIFALGDDGYNAFDDAMSFNENSNIAVMLMDKFIDTEIYNKMYIKPMELTYDFVNSFIGHKPIMATKHAFIHQRIDQEPGALACKYNPNPDVIEDLIIVMHNHGKMNKNTLQVYLSSAMEYNASPAVMKAVMDFIKECDLSEEIYAKSLARNQNPDVAKCITWFKKEAIHEYLKEAFSYNEKFDVIDRIIDTIVDNYGTKPLLAREKKNSCPLYDLLTLGIGRNPDDAAKIKEKLGPVVLNHIDGKVYLVNQNKLLKALYRIMNSLDK